MNPEYQNDLWAKVGIHGIQKPTVQAERQNKAKRTENKIN
jgi:hypothetical protein